MVLNAAGEVYLHYVQQGINKLEQGTKVVSNKFSSPSLKIDTFPTMASNVIIPKLSDFQQNYPTIDIRIETGMKVSDLRYDDFDLAIRMGRGDWPGVTVKKLLDLSVHAVCSPSFAKKHKLTSPEQISQVPLIDLANMNNVWRTWSQAMRLPEAHHQHKLTFSNYDASLQAAEQGLGLALAVMPIEYALIERKLLVLPFESAAIFDQALYAVYREEDKNRDDIHCFLDWLSKSPNLKPIYLPLA